MLCCPNKITQAIPNSNQNKHGGKLRGRWKFWFLVNVVSHITNNEYENLEILVEEEFTAEEFQIIEENKYKLSWCLLHKKY